MIVMETLQYGRSIVLGACKHNRIDGIEDVKFTDDQPFGEFVRATPNLRKDHLQR